MLPGLKTEAKIHILKDISGVIKPSRKVLKETLTSLKERNLILTKST